MFFPVSFFDASGDVVAMIGGLVDDQLVNTAPHSGTPWSAIDTPASGLPVTAGWRGIAYAPSLGRLLAVSATGGSGAYSDDKGETWTAFTSPATSAANKGGCCWWPGESKFIIIIGDDLESHTSATGATGSWTTSALPAAATTCGNIVWSDELDRVAMFPRQHINVGSTVNFWWSQVDGLWQEQAAAVTAGTGISSLCWSQARKEYIAVTGKNADGNYSRLAWHSVNATTWDSATIIASDINWTRVIWCARLNLYIALAGVSFDAKPTYAFCATSPDGATWTQRTMPATESWSDIVDTGFVLVAISADSTSGAYSVNGIDWVSSALTVIKDWGVLGVSRSDQ